MAMSYRLLLSCLALLACLVSSVSVVNRVHRDTAISRNKETQRTKFASFSQEKTQPFYPHNCPTGNNAICDQKTHDCCQESSKGTKPKKGSHDLVHQCIPHKQNMPNCAGFDFQNDKAEAFKVCARKEDCKTATIKGRPAPVCCHVGSNPASGLCVDVCKPSYGIRKPGTEVTSTMCTDETQCPKTDPVCCGIIAGDERGICVKANECKLKKMVRGCGETTCGDQKCCQKTQIWSATVRECAEKCDAHKGLVAVTDNIGYTTPGLALSPIAELPTTRNERVLRQRMLQFSAIATGALRDPQLFAQVAEHVKTKKIFDKCNSVAEDSRVLMRFLTSLALSPMSSFMIGDIATDKTRYNKYVKKEKFAIAEVVKDLTRSTAETEIANVNTFLETPFMIDGDDKIGVVTAGISLQDAIKDEKAFPNPKKEDPSAETLNQMWVGFVGKFEKLLLDVKGRCVEHAKTIMTTKNKDYKETDEAKLIADAIDQVELWNQDTQGQLDELLKDSKVDLYRTAFEGFEQCRSIVPKITFGIEYEKQSVQKSSDYKDIAFKLGVSAVNMVGNSFSGATFGASGAVLSILTNAISTGYEAHTAKRDVTNELFFEVMAQRLQDHQTALIDDCLSEVVRSRWKDNILKHLVDFCEIRFDSQCLALKHHFKKTPNAVPKSVTKRALSYASSLVQSGDEDVVLQLPDFKLCVWDNMVLQQIDLVGKLFKDAAALWTCNDEGYTEAQKVLVEVLKASEKPGFNDMVALYVRVFEKSKDFVRHLKAVASVFSEILNQGGSVANMMIGKKLDVVSKFVKTIGALDADKK